jgi:hypothetical protein
MSYRSEAGYPEITADCAWSLVVFARSSTMTPQGERHYLSVTVIDFRIVHDSSRLLASKALDRRFDSGPAIYNMSSFEIEEL